MKEELIMNSNNETKVKFWNSQSLAFLMLLVISAILFGGAAAFRPAMSDTCFNILIGIGISLGPAALLSLLFRWFLLDDVKKELLAPLVGLEQRTALAVEKKVEEGFTPILKKVELLNNLERLGVEYVYDSRENALRQGTSFFDFLKGEDKAIWIIGSSLRGLLQESGYEDVRNILLQKIGIIHFLLTHPCVADLRAFQENRNPGDIPDEIIESLEYLRDHKVKPEMVKLYKGTPTCFAIKTYKRMLLNPYTYTKQAMESPCFEISCDHPVYDAFNQAHFGAFRTAFSMEITNFDNTIQSLRSETLKYSSRVLCVLGQLDPKRCPEK